MIVSCYSAKCFPAHWKANVMLIISGEVTDACTPTHNCSHKGTLSKCWMELLIYQNGEWGRTGPILEHADIPFQYSQKKRNGEKLCIQIVLYRALSSFLLKIVTVSIMPQTLSGAGVVSADQSFVWWKNVNPWGEQKPQECSLLTLSEVPGIVVECLSHDTGKLATVHQECMTVYVKAVKEDFDNLRNTHIHFKKKKKKDWH